MKAKFFTEDSLSECYKYTAPQALGAIVLGLVIAAMALAAGITVFVLKSMIGGSLLLASLMMLALIILYYGFFGANKMIKSNTILVNTKTKETILTDEQIIESTTGEKANETRVFDYQYVSSAKYSKGMFVLYLTDGTSILFSTDKMIEGDIDEIRIFLLEKFGKAYLDKTIAKEVTFFQEVESESAQDESATNNQDEQENTDGQSDNK